MGQPSFWRARATQSESAIADRTRCSSGVGVTRYDRTARNFLSALALAATLTFWAK